MAEKSDENSLNKGKPKEFYVLIVFSKTKESEIKFEYNCKNTKELLFFHNSNNGMITYYLLLKHIYTPKNSSEIVDLSFNNKGEIFKVSFKSKEGTFIFDPILKIKKNKIAPEKAITQKNIIKIVDKINIFEKSLESREDIKESTKLMTLYTDSVDYFSANKDFELLVYLFVKTIDQKYKDICNKLLEIFWMNSTNDKISLLINQSDSCKQYLEKIKSISLEAEKIISENNFDKTRFYGFILFYLNIYDYEQFKQILKNFQKQNEDKKFFFDILIQFSSTFSNNTILSLEQYVNYLQEKDFTTLETSGFVYFKQIEEFIHVINKNKAKLVQMTGFKTLKIPKNLKYELKEPDNLLKELNLILDFSKNKKLLLLFLSGTFWKEMSKIFENPTTDHIVQLFQLRENFKKYFEFIKEQYPNKEHAFYKNAKEIDGKDEFAIILNKIIEKYIKQTQDITNEEIINQIT